MATIINNSSSSFDKLINYVLTDFNDPIFNELSSNSTPNTTEPRKSQETPPKGKKRKIINYFNQPVAKKALVLNPSLSFPKNSVTMLPSKLINTINKIYEKVNAYSLEKIQAFYANQLNVDLQEIKSIYLAVSIHCPTANESSVAIRTSLPAKYRVVMDPTSKEKLVNTINQIHKKAIALSFEKIQLHYANRLNVDLQEIKNIYLAVSTHCPTANESSVINVKASLPAKYRIVDPTFKKNLVNAINQAFDKIKASHLEKIQAFYANQLNVDLQEIKSIYLAISNHCPTTNKSSVITKASLPAKYRIVMNPTFKENLVNAINQTFDKIKASHLEKIQTFYANKLNVDLQEVKNIYFFVSPYDSAIEITPHKLKPLDLELKDSSIDRLLLFSPITKKNLADNIAYLFDTTDVSLEEIQRSYANQFKIALQDVKDIYLAISTHCPSVNTVSKIKIVQ
ncbi:hypothetical protein [Candidatus Rhabdochlamydia sp. T3358]|uniref:hypothetical protein n=1 Tax=Candidatus Rhabdochlamydia sp. T3358 TaxID=2099795 RepID=UPI0010B3E709|nr:hypothetical protein [Candidatus Rhabdochlamydia sp. T3358]VHO04016.1 hypothetical protein RHT_01180 [Candidatus Rhabdochlamydia sp. T3358]